MIPKIIHYCWFGGNERPEIVNKCIKSWSKLNGYKIIEWNESNCDFNENNYLKAAYENKKWAFVSDYIRLKVLNEYGGIYLDTDVEVKKRFDDTFLENNFFLSFMFNCNLSTAIIGSSKNNYIIKDLLELYSDRELEIVPNNDLFTKYFLENYKNFKLNNKFQMLGDRVVIFPKEYFECPTLSKNMGYSVHHFTGSWKKGQSRIKKVVKNIMGNYLYQNIIRARAINSSPFKEIYIKHKK